MGDDARAQEEAERSIEARRPGVGGTGLASQLHGLCTRLRRVADASLVLDVED